MCLILFAWQTHSEYPLIVAANRDEFYARRTRAASWWGQAVSLLAGRDEEAGGTWLGINRRGRFAVVTNVRAPNERNPHATSRGLLVLSALQTSQPMREWIDDCLSRAHTFNGFNLIVAEPVALGSRGAGAELAYISNRVGDPVRRLQPGIYGLSNASLDTPWPKVTRAVSAFACQIAQRVSPDSLLRLRADRDEAEPLIEALGVHLREELDLPVAPLPSSLHQTQQQGCTDSLPARFARHRDPPDVPVRQQASRSQRSTRRSRRQRMNADRIHRVEFQFERNALLRDKHLQTDASRLLSKLVPRAQPDLKIPRGRHP